MWAYLKSPSLTGGCLKAFLWNISTYEKTPHISFTLSLRGKTKLRQVARLQFFLNLLSNLAPGKYILSPWLGIYSEFAVGCMGGHHADEIKTCTNSMTVFACCPSSACTEIMEQLLVLLTSFAFSFLTHQWAPGGSTGTVCGASGKVRSEKVQIQIILSFLFPHETCDENTAEILNCNPF